MSEKGTFDVFSSKFAQDIFLQKYSMNGTETWGDCCERVVNAVCGQLLDAKAKAKILKFMKERKFIPGGRYLYSSGRSFHQVNNCFLFRAEDTREGWADLMGKATSALLTGGGIGVDYSAIRPKGAAPNGTIGILAETTTGIEPLFCKSYKRRYFKDGKWMYQYVVDGAVKRLQALGVKLDNIEDSYDISFKQRVKFQADVQQYVDMSISSTCNMPSWGSPENNEQTLEKNAMVLLKYAKRLRGFTCYPDGCRGGQPLTRADLEEALASEGMVFDETEQQCVNGVCGI